MTAPETGMEGAGMLEPVSGVRIATAAIGDVYGDRPNMLLAAFEPGTVVAGVLTRSSTAAAPVRWTRARLAEGAAPRALVVNAGNANCFTGAEGEAAVERTADMVSRLIGCGSEEVYIASTGRIGQQLDMAAYENALAAAGAALSEDNWKEVAGAVMTTDRFAKSSRRRINLGAGATVLQGITKGNTMIAPDMATTLSFLFSDVAAEAETLTSLLRQAVARTYNRITVDNTQSTNDTILLFATGKGPCLANGGQTSDFEIYGTEMQELLRDLAGMIIEDAGRDGVIFQISVTGAESEDAAVRMARAVADSYLVRRDVVRGHDLMPGRIVAAVGMAEEQVALSRLTLTLGGEILTGSGNLAGAPIVDARPHIRDGRLDLEIDVGIGDGKATVYTVATLS